MKLSLKADALTRYPRLAPHSSQSEPKPKWETPVCGFSNAHGYHTMVIPMCSTWAEPLKKQNPSHVAYLHRHCLDIRKQRLNDTSTHNLQTNWHQMGDDQCCAGCLGFPAYFYWYPIYNWSTWKSRSLFFSAPPQCEIKPTISELKGECTPKSYDKNTEDSFPTF